MPYLERHFGGTPVIAVTFPTGFGGDAVYHHAYREIPNTISTIPVQTSTGTHEYVRLNAHNVEWLCDAHGAVELHSWSPAFDAPDRAAFARLVLSPHGSVTEDDVIVAAREIAARLESERLRAFPVLDGFRGLTLWIPFTDGPTYDRLSAWLHTFAADLAVAHPQRFTVAPLRADRGERIYLGTKSNHPGMGTLLPYAVRGTPELEVSLPLGWDDLGKVRNGKVTAGGFAEYMRLFGDVFERERALIGPQPFGDRPAKRVDPVPTFVSLDVGPRNYIIAAALAVLADGNPHDADDILAQGRARGLLPESTTRKYVYTALHEYVVRTLGAGKTPTLVQIGATASFRLNVPPDPWPAIDLPPPAPWLDAATVANLTARLRASSIGDDPTTFEVAACDAYGALGFLATHVGGNAAPDGILVAPLGVATYRVILECKTASPGGIVANPRPEEAAKFRDAANATHSILLGPAFGNDASLDSELATHAVSLWTVDDLVLALTKQVGPDELRPALAPGRATPALTTLLWERERGRRKRVAVLADRLACVAWRTQETLARTVDAVDTPALSEETLFVLVDDALAAEGIVAGAHLDETRAAITSLEVSGIFRREDPGFIARRPPPLRADR